MADITPGVKGIKISPSYLRKRQSQQSSARQRFIPIPRSLPRDGEEPLKNCDKFTTPACIKALYGFSAQDTNAHVSPDNSMGIFETSTSYRQDDLNRFYQDYTPYIPRGIAPEFRRIDGAVLPSQTKHTDLDPNNLVADLDFLCAIPIVYPQTTTDFQTDDINGGYYDGIYNTFFDATDGSYCTYCAYGECDDAKGIDPTYPDERKGRYSNKGKLSYKGKLQCGVFEPTNVVSFSCDEYEQDLPYYYQRRQCNEFLKLGLKVVSILTYSGDTGVAGDDYSTHNGCLRHCEVFDAGQASFQRLRDGIR